MLKKKTNPYELKSLKEEREQLRRTRFPRARFTNSQPRILL